MTETLPAAGQQKFFRRGHFVFLIIDLCLILSIVLHNILPPKGIMSLIRPTKDSLYPLTQVKNTKEIFGFAPFWTFDQLDGVDFNVLTTFAYFGIEVAPNGELDKVGPGYETFISAQATDIFKKAHQHGTRVVLTLTQMDNSSILALLDDEDAQDLAINQAVSEVEKRGIDGINIDFEYSGDPGDYYRNKFSIFAEKLTRRMHQQVPSSKVTVSVYASAVKDPKVYDVAALSKSTDGIFMMAYDFAVAGSDNAIPTAPLNGHKEGKYWYDISTAVDDFLTLMPANKLILGVPWYGYNYAVYDPVVKAETRPYYSWAGSPATQTYAQVLDNIKPSMEGIQEFLQGWDEFGKVSWKAYFRADTGTWRMVFVDDPKSLNYKYDFAKEKNLAGVGMWALGFEDGKKELWTQLKEKFGLKDLADSSVINRDIKGSNEL